MDDHKEEAVRAARVAAIGARGEQIKTNSAEYLWLCCGIKPAPLPDLPVASNTATNTDQPQLRQHPLHRVPLTKLQRR